MFEFITSMDISFILLVALGSFTGLIVGAMPGLSVTMATALLVSITFTWTVNNAIGMIMGVYVVGVFSGAVTAILVNIPGAPASVATTLDGFPMTKKGEAKKALKTATIYSFLGSVVGMVILALVAQPITKIALMFSPMDYFLLALFGLTTVGSLTSKNFVKGLISAALGVFLGLIGMDPIMGMGRFTYGSMNLLSGIPLIAALIGLFGFSEILMQVSDKSMKPISHNIEKDKISTRKLLKYFPLGLFSALIGTLIGALPGAGGPVASLIAYDQAKKTTKNPTAPFGEGAVEGIVASESANNACIGGALIPMLTLGIPGDAVTAVIISALYVHNLQPGPLLFTQTPDLFYTLLVGGFIGCIMILVLGFTVAPQLAKIVLIPKKILLPLVAILCVIGAYAISGKVFDVLLMILFGFAGFIMKKRGYSVAPMVLGLVLGKMMDENFRRAVSLAQYEDNPIFAMFSSPISIILICLVIFSLLSNLPAFKKIFSGKKNGGTQ